MNHLDDLFAGFDPAMIAAASRQAAADKAETRRATAQKSANVNTNPRIEQSAIHCGRDLHAFYLEFFSGIQSIDKHSKAH
jgi:hypothetical protein